MRLVFEVVKRCQSKAEAREVVNHAFGDDMTDVLNGLRQYIKLPDDANAA